MTATPRPWTWTVEDVSMATLEGPKGMEDHVLSISPCNSCIKSAVAAEEDWRWGRCTTPSADDARLIVRAVNAHEELMAMLKIYVHAWDTGNAVPPHIVEQAKSVLAKAEGKE